MGVEAAFVNSHREIAEAVETALKSGKPHLIEIPVTGVAGK
jgi:thiamine pyrophosphate-dependent acetolactate synthase large subunit-like protein